MKKQILKTALFKEDENTFTYIFECAVRRILYSWMKYEAEPIAEQLNNIACVMYEELLQEMNGLGKKEKGLKIDSKDRCIYFEEAIYHHVLKLYFTTEDDWISFLKNKIDFYLETLYSLALPAEKTDSRIAKIIWENWEEDQELHKEIIAVTNDNNAGNKIDKVMEELIKKHDKKWKN
ncbi:MAG TPA: hypothetical protein ENI51_08015 [Candidatus Atribacteria bacterium]|nr:hypothetical protein [Candidatus Atribacteria bacterium]